MEIAYVNPQLQAVYRCARQLTITSTEAVLAEYVKEGFSTGVHLPSKPEELAITIQNVLRNTHKYR